MREVAPGIYALAGLKTGRAYLIAERDALTLIDTSTHSASERIVAAIIALGRETRDLTTIVATHYHHDHTGNADALRAQTGAEFCAHADDAPYIEGERPWLVPRFATGPLAGMAPKQVPIVLDRRLKDGDVLPATGGLHVVHAPGHTPGHIALYAPERGVLFAGDAFMNVLGLRLPPAMASHDMEAARASVRRLAGLEFDVALPGHGAPVIGRASDKLRMWVRDWL